MAVVAKMVDGTIQFHPQTQADNALGHYLSDLVNKARKNGLSKSTGAAELLLKQAADWEERSRSTTLSPEVKSYLAQKASEARKQARGLE
jgi:hypothetical protein